MPAIVGLFGVLIIGTSFTWAVSERINPDVVDARSHETWNTIMTLNYVGNIQRTGENFRLVRESPNNPEVGTTTYNSYPIGTTLIPLLAEFLTDSDLTVGGLRRVSIAIAIINLPISFFAYFFVFIALGIRRTNASVFSVVGCAVVYSLPGMLVYQTLMWNYESSFNHYVPLLLLAFCALGQKKLTGSLAPVYIVLGALAALSSWAATLMFIWLALLNFLLSPANRREALRSSIIFLVPVLITFLMFFYQTLESTAFLDIVDKIIYRLTGIDTPLSAELPESNQTIFPMMSWFDTYFWEGAGWLLMLCLLVFPFLAIKIRKSPELFDKLFFPLIVAPAAIFFKLILFLNHTNGHTFSVIELIYFVPVLVFGTYFCLIHSSYPARLFDKALAVGALAASVPLIIVNYSHSKELLDPNRFEYITEIRSILKKNQPNKLLTHNIHIGVTPPQLAYLVGRNGYPLACGEPETSDQISNVFSGQAHLLYAYSPPDCLTPQEGLFVEKVAPGLFYLRYE